MLPNRKGWRMMVVMGGIFMGMSLGGRNASACKVLVVMAYWEEYFWSQDIKTGIESILGSQCELKYAYLNAMKEPDGVKAKAQQAYALYQEWQPDGVITTNDDAQTFFVLPYLKDKVKTPVMFAGIFATPETYGYPASNVSGIRERAYFKEALLFMQQLTPTPIQSFALIAPDLEAAKQVAQVLENVRNELGLTVFEAILSNNLDELLQRLHERIPKLDALFIPAIYDQATTQKFITLFGKPTFSGWRPAVEFGVLCAVAEDGKRLGTRAAEMLLQAMNGTPMAELPVTQNEFGIRMINVNTLKALGLQPSRRVLTGVELLK